MKINAEAEGEDGNDDDPAAQSGQRTEQTGAIGSQQEDESENENGHEMKNKFCDAKLRISDEGEEEGRCESP